MLLNNCWRNLTGSAHAKRSVPLGPGMWTRPIRATAKRIAVATPKMPSATTPATAHERHLATKLGGAATASRATPADSEYVTETAALMATIWPKRENGRRMACVSGTAAAMVVTALLTIDVPMCVTATRVRHRRIAPG